LGQYLENWILASRQDCRLRVFENMALSGIFVSKRDEGLEKLRNERLLKLYYSPNTVRKNISKRMW
jgi:hypothetical protein